MIIQKINYTNRSTFKSAHRVYSRKAIENFNSFDSKHIHTTTNLFREDIDWIGLINYIARHFSDKDKVNSYSLACSDGSEAYTYAICIIEKFLDKVSKFLPIKASDIDDEMLRAAESGRINVYGGEFKTVDKLDIDMRKYFINPAYPKQYTDDEVYLYVNSSSYEPVKSLRDSVEFKKSDILTELKNINDDGNSIVMCRNVLPYLDDNYINDIVNTAKEKLKRGSLFIVGDYDHRIGIEEKLLNNGFFKPLIGQNNVFERGTDKELIDRLLMGYLV